MKIQTLFLRFLTLNVLILPMAYALAQVHETDPLSHELRILTDWFEGEFDNEEQVRSESNSKLNITPEDRHTWVNAVNFRISLPEFGDYVFYVEEYVNGNPVEINRQRLTIFSVDTENDLIRMQQGYFKDGSKVKGAHTNPQLLENVKSDSIIFLDECDVTWQRKNGRFEGQMGDKTCQNGQGDMHRYYISNQYLSPETYSRHDAAFLFADDSLYHGPVLGTPIELKRRER